ncbi:YitT family protein [Paenibacillus sp. GCM10012307]|uniref:YitT family protein n=1 Tax=Paenibacillus roseus TaxID=2798579 RepID=A0A934J2G2_9BACL|nr:YitT family protein [Paenibacillus roseus]MBJ6363556.1 YitT family protein [Paenibacillus roseus]
MGTGIHPVRSIFFILLGTAIYAFGLHYFVLPNKLMEGGVTGVAVLLNYALGWPLSLSILLLNIPLFIVGWRLLGWRSMVLTFIGTGALTVFLALIEGLIHHGWLEPFKTDSDYILVALYAGVVLGTGLGIVFRFGGTTGGADIIARVASKKRGWSIGQIILTMDAIIIGASLFYISKEKVLYTLVTVFIASKIIDFIQEGAYSVKSFSIITDHGEHVAERITKEIDRGVTLLPAVGAYSGRNKHMVYCVVSRHEIQVVKTIVKTVDPAAFMIISEVNDVVGEGFNPG